MVYGGRPSRGCQTCKTRKIKCDETRPTCTQCSKSSRTCLGYKDESDLIFRNQTDKVAFKAQKPKKLRSSKSPDSSTVSSQAAQTPTESAIVRRNHQSISNTNQLPRRQQPDSSTSTICSSPTVRIEEEVVHVYFRNFARLYQTQDTVRGFLPFLAPMYSASAENSLLRVATHAAALCAISQLPEQTHLQYRAAAIYGKAIRAVAIALQDPLQRQSDETLQATLLLCLYESIKASDNSIDAWSNHVDGASAIVQSRGALQLEDPQSLALFRAVRTQMLINCIRQGKSPKEYPAGVGWLCDTYLDGDALAHLTHCMIELPSLMEKIRIHFHGERKPDTMRSMNKLIERACHLEAAMQDWAASLTDDWRPRTVAYIREQPTDPEHADAWVGPVHAYTDVHRGGVMNKLHSCHMLCAAIILNGLEWLRPNDYLLDDRYLHTRYIEQRTVDDICSSVPFYLGLGKERARNPDQMETIADLIGGYSLIWPLHASYSCPRISKDQRAYIYGRLAKIARDCGLEQALLIPQDIRGSHAIERLNEPRSRDDHIEPFDISDIS